MYYTSLDYLDRLRAKNIFKGTYSTLLGLIGSLVLIAAILAFYLPTIISFFQGTMYYQSEFPLQQTPYGNITIPRDFRVALVFYNKTDNTIANHTLLRQYLSIVTYEMSGSNTILKSDTILPSCDPNYFQNTLNPPQNFTDCIIFAENSKVDITYSPSKGYVSFGFYSFVYCVDPFKCLINSAFKNASINNFINVFTNFTYTLYYTSRVLQPDASFKDQVFATSSSSFNTPFTITADSYAEIQIRNTTLDNSLMPWFNYQQKTGPAWYGTMADLPKITTAVGSAGVRAGFVASRYQNQVFRYYKKVDWLLGIIGGAMFLFFIALYLPLYYLNQWSKQGELIEQFLIKYEVGTVEENGVSDQRKLLLFGGTVQLHKVEQSKLHVFTKLLPYCESREERELKRVLDIAGAIKMRRVAERNINRLNIPLFNKHRQLRITIDNQVKITNQAQALPDTSQIGQQLLGPGHLEQNSVINDELSEPELVQHEKPQSKENEQQVQVHKKQEQVVVAQQKPKEEIQFTEQRLDQLTAVDPQTIDKYSKLSGMHPEVLQAVIKSNNITQLMGINPTLMAIANKEEQYKLAYQPYCYSRIPKKRQSRCARLWKYFFDCLRFFDIFGVQPQFGLHSSGSSIFGCLCSLFIAGCSVLFFILIILNAMNYQTFIQYDFQDVNQIKYNLVTGVGFRPFFCVNTYSGYAAINSSNPTIQLTFFSNNGSQRTTIPMINLGANMQSYLGIAADSSYYSINTKYCWVMQDGYTIPMGGYNTSNQAYFGFRFDPYCSGTVAYCQSINSTLKSRIASFLSSSFYNLTLYLPFNTFDPQTQTLSGGGFNPQIIRQGTSGISINGGSVQSFYVNSIQLVDDYTMRFMDSEKPPVIQQTITTDRYQLGSNIYGVPATIPFYQVRVRPSNQLTKVVLTGTPTDVVLGVIGGICAVFYAVLHWFGKLFDQYHARCALAEQLYGQKVLESSFFHKLLVLLLPECLCRCLSEQTKKSVLRDKQVDRIIQFQLNHSELIKQWSTIYQLSTAGFTTLVEKFLGLVYFKQPVPEDYFNQKQEANEIVQAQQQYVGLEQEYEPGHSQSQSRMQRHEHGVANLQQPPLQNQAAANNYDSLDGQAHELRQQIQQVQPYNIHRFPHAPPQSNKFLQFMDFFSTKPSFTLNGQRKIRSVFGSCIFLGMAAAIIILVLYQLQAYVDGSNSRISYQKYMITDISNQPGLMLNSSNFRLALGFYLNPNASLVNVSSLVNTSSNVVITVSQINLIRGSNNLLTQTETTYPLAPCTNDYFDSFKDNNTDYAFLNNLPFAWCLPLNLSLNLTPISTRNVMQYMTVRVINITNDTATTTNLRTLTSTYAVALYMTIPQIDLASRSFKYMVKQIRGVPKPTTSSLDYNVTLTKQQIVYTTPNYTLNPPATTVSSYVYLNNKYNEMNYTAINTSLARSLNITFGYMGLVQKYVYQQPNANEIVGVIGGLIALFYAVALFIAEPFNMYKFKYLVGKQLYLIRSNRFPSSTNHRQKRMDEAKRKDEVGQKGHAVDQQYMEYEVQLNQFELLACWLLSFFCNCKCFRKLKLVSILQSKAGQALNLNEFLVRTAQLKDTLNKAYSLQSSPNIKVSNLFSKFPIIQEQRDYQQQQVNKEYLNKHGLSSFDQYVLSLANRDPQSFKNVFKDSSIFRKMYYRDDSFQSNHQNQQELNKEKRSQSFQGAEPDLQQQTTKFQELPKESFEDLRHLERHGVSLMKEQREVQPTQRQVQPTQRQVQPTLREVQPTLRQEVKVQKQKQQVDRLQNVEQFSKVIQDVVMLQPLMSEILVQGGSRQGSWPIGQSSAKQSGSSK